MKIQNNRIVGFIMLVIGLGIFFYWGNILAKMVYLPFSGTTTEAKVIGFKSKGSKWIVKNGNSGSKNILTGKRPFFEFISIKNELIKSHSKAPQIFVFFNYSIGEKISVAYPLDNAANSIILNWREVPGLLMMLAFGILIIVVGWSYLKGS
ncbi:hypothetical protein [Lacihabitans sp. CS3-21]|uniref:hypothetical protein n=1 Tax=Lacihabitans sp. CS3-21 TaxID=2487332 RepID=UPI0020CF2D90|nr:hypothetical protein [Lacihabitans sp. CS3-21]MCP9745488.1 hypothetical protein [Lacihabitans sp. CS3-21]